MKGVIRREREGSAGVVRGMLSVILNECEGSVIVVRKSVRRHPEQMRRSCTRDEENGKKIKAISCELSATS